MLIYSWGDDVYIDIQCLNAIDMHEIELPKIVALIKLFERSKRKYADDDGVKVLKPIYNQ